MNVQSYIQPNQRRYKKKIPHQSFIVIGLTVDIFLILTNLKVCQRPVIRELIVKFIVAQDHLVVSSTLFRLNWEITSKKREGHGHYCSEQTIIDDS